MKTWIFLTGYNEHVTTFEKLQKTRDYYKKYLVDNKHAYKIVKDLYMYNYFIIREYKFKFRKFKNFKEFWKTDKKYRLELKKFLNLKKHWLNQYIVRKTGETITF